MRKGGQRHDMRSGMEKSKGDRKMFSGHYLNVMIPLTRCPMMTYSPDD